MDSANELSADPVRFVVRCSFSPNGPVDLEVADGVARLAGILARLLKGETYPRSAQQEAPEANRSDDVIVIALSTFATLPDAKFNVCLIGRRTPFAHLVTLNIKPKRGLTVGPQRERDSMDEHLYDGGLSGRNRHLHIEIQQDLLAMDKAPHVAQVLARAISKAEADFRSNRTAALALSRAIVGPGLAKSRNWIAGLITTALALLFSAYLAQRKPFDPGPQALREATSITAPAHHMVAVDPAPLPPVPARPAPAATSMEAEIASYFAQNSAADDDVRQRFGTVRLRLDASPDYGSPSPGVGHCTLVGRVDGTTRPEIVRSRSYEARVSLPAPASDQDVVVAACNGAVDQILTQLAARIR